MQGVRMLLKKFVVIISILLILPSTFFISYSSSKNPDGNGPLSPKNESFFKDLTKDKQKELEQVEEIADEFRFISDWISEEDLVPSSEVFPSLSAEERYNIIKEILYKHKKTASDQIIQSIVKKTTNFNECNLKNLVIKIAKTSKLKSITENRYFESPTPKERFATIKEALSLADIPVPENLIIDIVELTDQYSLHTVKKLVRTMIKKSKRGSLDPGSCITTLRKAIDLLDDEEEAKNLKLTQIEEIALKYTPQQASSNVETIAVNQNIKKYPLLKDIFHPDKLIFIEAAKQLKAGKFRNTFLRGILIYGPPGVGKDAIVKAMVNESGCQIFSITASELVNKYQGSGAGGIKKIFDQARSIEPNKGVIVLIDELQSVAPVTTDKNVPIAHTRSGQDFDNVFTQFWAEFDRCINDENNNNLLLMATCNQFNRIDERIRERFNCIEFSYPDKKGTYEILKNKSQYYGISLSESDLQKYTEKMKNLSGRDLDKFIKNTSEKIRSGKNNSEALEFSAKEQETAKNNAKIKKPSKKSWPRKIWDGSVGAGKWVAKRTVEAVVNNYFRSFFGKSLENSSSNYEVSDDVLRVDTDSNLNHSREFLRGLIKKSKDREQ
jgi:SpoVK/Ycf46/Vps4 family AAA+-type ATPase